MSLVRHCVICGGTFTAKCRTSRQKYCPACAAERRRQQNAAYQAEHREERNARKCKARHMAGLSQRTPYSCFTHTLDETAAALGITRQRVAQLERAGLAKIRKAFAERFGIHSVEEALA